MILSSECQADTMMDLIQLGQVSWVLHLYQLSAQLSQCLITVSGSENSAASIF